MNKQELKELGEKLRQVGERMNQAIADCEAYDEDVIVARCETCERMHAFDHERGRVVRWDGDLWLLNDYEDAIMALGHTRGGRTVVADGDPENGDITLQCLEPVQ